MLEQLPGRLNERRQRTIGRGIKEAIELDHRTGVGSGHRSGHFVDSVGPDDLDTRLRPNVSRGPHQDEDRLDVSIRALAVVAAQVARVGGGLVDIDALGYELAFELED